MNFNKIWNRIQVATGIKNLNELAEIVETSQPTVSRIKKGGMFPADWAFKVGQAYNLSTDWIMTGEGPERLGEQIRPPSQDEQNQKEVGKEEERAVERRCQDRRIKDLISPNLSEAVEALRSLEKKHPKSFFIMLGKILEEVRNQENQPEEAEKKNAANH